MRIGLITAIAAGALAVAAPAQAAKGTYAGSVTSTTGKIALDVKIQQGFVTKITHLRGKGIPATCEVSGPIPLNIELSSQVPVDQQKSEVPVEQNAKFKGAYTQPTYGNVSTIKGTFFGGTVEGKLDISHHYQAEGQHPEENCETGKIAFKAKFGAPDGTQRSRPNWR
jgi:hypothetical protein